MHIKVQPPCCPNALIRSFTIKDWMQFIYIGDLLVNLANVVAFDIDKGKVTRIWYTGSATPVPVESGGSDEKLVRFLKERGYLLA
jgi:hypothetical protein